MPHLQLQIQHISNICHFRLTWSNNQQLSAQIPYPAELFQQYKIWRSAYLKYYGNSQRGRGGNISKADLPPVDNRSPLRDTEATFLQSFQTWLNHEKLLPIRTKIAKATQATEPVDLFITCDSIDLDRLPWETWDITTGFPQSQPIHITRVPANIDTSPPTPRKRPKLRILAILGDDRNLDLQKEKATLKSLRHLADVQFVGYQAEADNSQLRAAIRTQIIDAVGWDILFFAGHSNEKQIIGGELGIAPGQSLSIQEIVDDLKIAKANGLQLAFFNSCKGLDIANSLINLGLSQVVIMREPVRNDVAQQLFSSFIHYFIQQRQTFHQALISACQDLKTDPNLDYPSSHWIPSLFGHPGATLPQLPLTQREKLKRQWAPTRWEIALLAGLSCLSLINPLQNALLDRRIWVQAIYRQASGQLPPKGIPPVRLISIDKDSLDLAKINKPRPLPWGYLAQILDRLAPTQPKILGIDYILDEPEKQKPEDVKAIGQSVRSLIQQQQTWIVLAAENGISAHPATGITPFAWVMQGDVNSSDWFLPLPKRSQPCNQDCPLAYLLAASARLQASPQNLPQPNLQPSSPFQTQVITQLQTSPKHQTFRQRATTKGITEFSRNLRQYWLQPIYDFSIPPNYVYDVTPASQLFKEPNPLKNVSQAGQQIILIAAGGYQESGLNDQHQDYGRPPAAIPFWTPPDQPSPKVFTGGELHAYAIHHLLKQHFVIPIPDLWMILSVGIIGKFLTNIRLRRKWLLFCLGSLAYSMIALQAYISWQIMIPILFPLVTIASYLWLSFRRK